MYQPIRTLARTLLVPAALAAVAFAGQSAASASTLGHFQAPAGSAVGASTSAAPQAHYAAHFYAVPQAHYAAHFYAVPQAHWSNGKWG